LNAPNNHHEEEDGRKEKRMPDGMLARSLVKVFEKRRCNLIASCQR